MVSGSRERMRMETAMEKGKEREKEKEKEKGKGSLQFAHSFKDLRNLREQLYSAAQYFESSYHKHNHKQFVVESSKDYIGKALVSTVDHLGSVAHKLTILLDQKANDFFATNLRFSFIQQRLRTVEEFNNRRGISLHSLMVDATNTRPQHRHYNNFNVPASGDSCPCPPTPRRWDIMHISKKDVSLSKGFLGARKMSSCKRQDIRMGSSSKDHDQPLPPNTHTGFSFTSPNNEPRKRSISPLGFRIKRTESFSKRSVSPVPCVARRAISACRTRREATNRETEAAHPHSYTKTSMHLFKALLNVHRSRKDTIAYHK